MSCHNLVRSWSRVVQRAIGVRRCTPHCSYTDTPTFVSLWLLLGGCNIFCVCCGLFSLFAFLFSVYNHIQFALLISLFPSFQHSSTPLLSLRFLYPMYMLPHCLFFILFALSISPEEQRKAVGVLAIVFYFSFFISPSSGLCSNSVSALSIVSTRVWESASVKARGGLIFNTFSHLPST